ncbi:MAG: sulfite exporter TauE/SafE family protein [Verrucomicrobiales bacterium]|nr:sulfite exporter TauE/SafE family protein [Verrucomicrobiales bacterium]
MQLIFIAIIIGALAALLGSLLGVGGGIIMVPAFKGFLGLSMKQAIATSLAVMIVTASVASFRYAQEGLVNWKIAGFAAIAAVVAALLGSELMKSLSSDFLRVAFGIFLIAFGVYMLFFQKAVSG